MKYNKKIGFIISPFTGSRHWLPGSAVYKLCGLRQDILSLSYVTSFAKLGLSYYVFQGVL